MEDRIRQVKEQLVAFKNLLGLRDDWHEPDEQEVTAKVTGLHFDNAMGTSRDGEELVVVIFQKGVEAFRINLAILLAVASSEGE